MFHRFGRQALGVGVALLMVADYIADDDGNGVQDGLQYDRSVSVKPGAPWRSGPPDGGIGLGTDVLAMLAQTGNTCS